MVLQLFPEAAPLCCPDCVHRQSYPRHVQGEGWKAGTVQAGHGVHVLQADENSANLRRGQSQQRCTEEEKRPIIRGNRNTDRTTRLLVVILVLFLIAEFPLVGISSSLARVTFSYAGNSGSFLSCFGKTIFPSVL